MDFIAAGNAFLNLGRGGNGIRAVQEILRRIEVPVIFVTAYPEDLLTAEGHECVSAFDINPRRDDIRQHDASFMSLDDVKDATCIITNPPWDRPVLHQIIERCLLLQMPAWLLFDADWMHTRQAAPYLPHCRKIVSVGRVKWIEGSDMAGKDNCCWYMFDGRITGFPHFYGRPL
jgi:hypothetical protein